MDSVKLKEYLGIVVDMEKNIYLQERLLDVLQKKILSLSTPAPILSLPAPPASPKGLPAWYWIVVILGGLFCGALAFIAASLVWGIFFMNSFKVLQDTTIWAVLCAPIFAFGAVIYSAVHAAKTAKTTYDSAVKEYQRTIADLKQNHAEKEREYEQRSALRSFLKNECERITSLLEQSRNRLARIYSANIIFPKYRNLVMTSSLYEYVSAGRCSQLEGAHGGYNILEEEIRLNYIITRLDKIATQLQEIKSRQYMLYSILVESNETLKRLSLSAVQISDNGTFTAYQSMRTNQELQYMNRLKYLIN